MKRISYIGQILVEDGVTPKSIAKTLSNSISACLNHTAAIIEPSGVPGDPTVPLIQFLDQMANEQYAKSQGVPCSLPSPTSNG